MILKISGVGLIARYTRAACSLSIEDYATPARSPDEKNDPSSVAYDGLEMISSIIA
jgi:hypothetical protein